MSFLQNKKIVVTGGSGFLGKHVVTCLKKHGVIEKNIVVPRSKDFDLRDFEMCKNVVKGCDIIIHLAAHVGGIGLNREKPGELFYDNLMMGAQLMEAARLENVSKFVTVGTICAYPKFTPVPFKEDDLWNGYPEETNAPYGIAKKAILVQGQAYRDQYGFPAIYVMPTNLYGPGDNFDPSSSHVIPALIAKIDEAKAAGKNELVVWGDGTPSRDFLYVEDAAEAIVQATENYNGREPLNLGAGIEVTIRDLVEILCKIMDFSGEIVWDTTKPNGQPRRCLDIQNAQNAFGFAPSISFEEGLQNMVDWWRSQS